ncbi:hypothetical protein ABIF63_003355 [Bradyrhizobium japonicum]|uniref:Uncharacterized protein n=1 Tax=Bradyrhizobium japonicum TaxID=375 RepID=A0ABV2RQQ6_BRAJP
MTNQEHSWADDYLMDYEQGDCDQEDSEPLLSECV